MKLILKQVNLFQLLFVQMEENIGTKMAKKFLLKLKNIFIYKILDSINNNFYKIKTFYNNRFISLYYKLLLYLAINSPYLNISILFTSIHFILPLFSLTNIDTTLPLLSFL